MELDLSFHTYVGLDSTEVARLVQGALLSEPFYKSLTKGLFVHLFCIGLLLSLFCFVTHQCKLFG